MRIERHIFQDKNIIWFRRCVYLLLLLKLLLVWPELSTFYNFVLSYNADSYLPYRLMFLPVFHEVYHYYWLVACATVAFAIFYKANRWLAALVFIIGLNFIILTTKCNNSGDRLLTVFIFSIIFLKEGRARNSIAQFINSSTLLILQFHFCLLYLVNAFGKMIRPFWRDGSCFENIWNMPYYANVSLIPEWFYNPQLYFLTAWGTMLFEIIFPLLIWFKPFKKPLIIMGLLFHVGIAVLLSLPDFGLTMMIGYLLFYDFSIKTSRASSIA